MHVFVLHVFLTLLYCLFFSFELSLVLCHHEINETNYKNGKNELSDNHWVNVCFEFNIIDVPFDTWWLDSGATIQACNSMQASKLSFP